MTYALAGAGALALTGFLIFEWKRIAAARRLKDRLVVAPPDSGAQDGTLLNAPETSGPLFLRRLLRQSRLPLKPWDVVLIGGALSAGGAYAGIELALPALWIVALAGLMIGIPILILRSYAESRVRKLEIQLADAIDLMQGALQSGVGVRQSLELVRAEKRPPIREEIHELISLIELGLPASRAFQQWAEPIGSKIVDAFALSMSAKWDVGGSYKEMLSGMAGRIRDLLRLQRRVRSLTAEARLTTLLAAVIPYGVALFQTIFHREHLAALWAHPSRDTILGGALLMQICCLFVIRGMIRRVQ